MSLGLTTIFGRSSTPKPRPFSIVFEIDRRKPFAVLVLEANMPLVRAHQPYHEMREDFVQTARTVPHLYLDGVSLAAMGGEPYADWY